MGELIERFAAKAEKIYNEGTADHYTWLALFAEFSRRVQDQQILDGED